MLAFSLTLKIEEHNLPRKFDNTDSFLGKVQISYTAVDVTQCAAVLQHHLIVSIFNNNFKNGDLILLLINLLNSHDNILNSFQLMVPL